MVDGVNELHSGLLLQVDVSFRFRLQLDFIGCALEDKTLFLQYYLNLKAKAV